MTAEFRTQKDTFAVKYELVLTKKASDRNDVLKAESINNSLDFKNLNIINHGSVFFNQVFTELNN